MNWWQRLACWLRNRGEHPVDVEAIIGGASFTCTGCGKHAGFDSRLLRRP